MRAADQGLRRHLKRGTANYRLIETRIIGPVLAGRIPLRAGIDAIASARAAALLDPEGEALARCLAELERDFEPQHRRRVIAASEARRPRESGDPYARGWLLGHDGPPLSRGRQHINWRLPP